MEEQRFGKYIVVKQIGHGGMADVYEAVDPSLDRHVAIKVIHAHLIPDPKFAERFRREARLVAGLHHAYIVQLYEYSFSDEHPFMVMEYLTGGTLKTRLSSARLQGQIYDLVETAKILGCLASALDYAHSHNIIHRDLKPTNILFNDLGEPVLADFGIAKVLTESMALTTAGGLLGTPTYMSPEQAAGKPVTALSDLYALGVILFELATGQPPFQNRNMTLTMLQHIKTPPPNPGILNPALNPALQAVILKVLAKDPQQRYATATELAYAFMRSMGDSRSMPMREPGEDVLEATTVVDSTGTIPEFIEKIDEIRNPPFNGDSPLAQSPAAGETATQVSPSDDPEDLT